jgi:hypothetical protein
VYSVWSLDELGLLLGLSEICNIDTVEYCSMLWQGFGVVALKNEWRYEILDRCGRAVSIITDLLK